MFAIALRRSFEWISNGIFAEKAEAKQVEGHWKDMFNNFNVTANDKRKIKFKVDQLVHDDKRNLSDKNIRLAFVVTS